MMNILDGYWSISLQQLELVIEFTENLKTVKTIQSKKFLFVQV